MTYVNKNLQQEAEFISKMNSGDTHGIYNTLHGQLSVLQSRAQILVSIAGIVITVTGFSGRVIAGTHIISQILVVAGLFTVLTSAVYVLVNVMRINWMTSVFAKNTNVNDGVIAILKLRDKKNHAFRIGSIILFSGLVFYCTAISIMLINPY
jgi:hypothetical protein